MGPSSPPLPGESFDTCSKAVAFTLADPALLSVGKLGSTENGGELTFYMLGCDEVILLDGFDFLCNAISMRSTISIL